MEEQILTILKLSLLKFLSEKQMFFLFQVFFLVFSAKTKVKTLVQWKWNGSHICSFIHNLTVRKLVSKTTPQRVLGILEGNSETLFSIIGIRDPSMLFLNFFFLKKNGIYIKKKINKKIFSTMFPKNTVTKFEKKNKTNTIFGSSSKKTMFQNKKK